MLGEFILVDDLKANELLVEAAPYESRTSQTWRQLNEFHFESLWGVISDQPNAISTGHLKVLSAEDGEVWLIVFSNDYRDLLANFDHRDINSTSSKWFQTDGFKWGWSEKDVISLFESVCSLAKNAKQKDQSLVYWGRL
ncbi:hypothetical protein [Grimontia indica]|uniref:hypothetical protein n=1 Tax=Grimontia indica TaxID=1056512 RepID=UPI000587E24B|nr:hypothetical protein [Grimontia indica]